MDENYLVSRENWLDELPDVGWARFAGRRINEDPLMTHLGRLGRSCQRPRRETGLELIAQWTLVEDGWRLLGTKTGFTLVLKYFEIEGEFPRDGEQFPPAAVEFAADSVKLDQFREQADEVARLTRAVRRVVSVGHHN